MRSSVRLVVFNARLLLGLGYWLYVLPLAIICLTIFWYMATETMLTPAAAAQTPELVIPLIAAFLCAHVLGPEHRYRVAEIVLVRPVSFKKIALLRLLTIYAALAVATALMLLVYRFWIGKEFSLYYTFLAGIPSVLFLSMLALALAMRWRNPMLGAGVAGLYWVFDVLRGPQFNPAATLHSYAAGLAAAGYPTDWRLAKLVLLALSVICAIYAARALSQPPPQVRILGIVRSGALAIAMVCLLLLGGVWSKMEACRKIERIAPSEAAIRYFMQFDPYGRLPAAHLLGPAFAKYVGYGIPSPPGGPLVKWVHGRRQRIRLWQQVAERYPNSRWAANSLVALIDIAVVDDGSAAAAAASAEAAAGEQAGDADGDDSRDFWMGTTSTIEELEGYLDQLLAHHPDAPMTPHAVAAVARAQELVGRLEDSEKTRLMILERWPASAETMQAAAGLARLYLRRGEVAEASRVAALGARAAAMNQDAERLVELAQVLETCGDWAAASDAYKRASDAANAKMLELIPLVAQNQPTAASERAKLGRIKLDSLKKAAEMDQKAAGR